MVRMRVTVRVTVTGSECLRLTMTMAAFILKMHYPSRRTWASICSSSGYASLVQVKKEQDALSV